MHFIFDIDLQLFGEGGDGSGVTGSAAGGQTTGEAAQAEAPAAGEQNGESRNLDAEFEDLIKGEYKEVYGKRVQDTVTKRLKGTNETIDKYNAIAPVFELLAGKYGVDPSDVPALSRAIQEDNTYYEDEAMKRGISVEQYKSIRAIEKENAAYKEAEKQAAAQRLVEQWTQEGEQVKAMYSAFDLDTEMRNPEFQSLLKAGVSMKAAFEVLHKDELITGVMQKTAAAVKQQVVNDIAARGRRPAENGLAATANVHAKVDVKTMTKKDRQALIRRAAGGEKIVL